MATADAPTSPSAAGKGEEDEQEQLQEQRGPAPSSFPQEEDGQEQEEPRGFASRAEGDLRDSVASGSSQELEEEEEEEEEERGSSNSSLLPDFIPNSDSSRAAKPVQAFVRVKPTPAFAQDRIKFGPDNKSIDIHIPRDARGGAVNNSHTGWSFRMDGLLHNSSQDQVYQAVAKDLVAEALRGYNGTIMCYGQTGAGKTYTMTGATSEYQHRGIIPRAIQQVFRAAAESIEVSINIHISYLEIYNEALGDLLARGSRDTPLAVLEGPQGVSVRGLSIHPVSHEEQALSLFFEGESKRVIAEHALNRNSSRSHCIFTIYLECRSRVYTNLKGIKSRITLIDLAGSERLSRTTGAGQAQRENSHINRSLSFLEQLLLALMDPSRAHLPFRQSKLTHVLKDSLGRNCNTVLVTNICGEAAHVEDTLSSLRFASRMRWVSSEPAPNVTLEQQVSVKALEEEIDLLRRELALQDMLANRSFVPHSPLSRAQRAAIKSQIHKYLRGAIKDIEIVNVRQVQEVFKQFKVIVSQQQEEVEAKLRSKYTLIDKEEFPAGSGSWSDLDSEEEEEEKEEEKKEKKKDQAVEKLQAEALEAGAPSPSPVPDEKKEDNKSDEQINSPPSKPEAFELFKKEAGSEISRIFRENKRILLARKKRSNSIARRINDIKREVEGIENTLGAKRRRRWQEGEYVDEKGQVILDEKEFALVLKLRELQEEHRAGCAELQDLRAEIQYCQDLVDKCRRRLISEFEIWYNESFLIPEDVREALEPGGSIRPGMIPINRVMCLETFDRTMLSLQQMHRKPGIASAAGKNNPPSLLHTMEQAGAQPGSSIPQGMPAPEVPRVCVHD
ncbi:kinesin-like protein KIF9 isoform X2 [Pithys albifrons albifrons]|uniref:kinesin-like protein KIF9 isoform X2 n=1 Tax=Pithys albifrons albifrons TaxID=3385563 RepID=UPI003A5CC443